MLVRYGSLVASYFSKIGNTSLIIRCRGMPGLPSEKNEFGYLQTSGYDVVVPDYYGYARSDGIFTPSGCIDTILDTIKTFRGGYVLDVRANMEIFLQYDRIILVGSSFGGRVVCMTPKFDSTLKEIVLIYPRLAYPKYGKEGFIEETNDSFRRILKQGYGGFVRLANKEEREEMFVGQGPYIPMIHYTHLRDVSIFMGHGTADEVIHYTRTRNFYLQLKERNSLGIYQYLEYYGLGHNTTCKQAIMEAWLWSKQQKV